MVAGRRELERPPPPLLPANLGEIGHERLLEIVSFGRRREPNVLLAAQVGDRLREVSDRDRRRSRQGRPPDADSAAQMRSFETRPPHSFGDRDRARHGANAPVERELTDAGVLEQAMQPAAGASPARTARAIGRSNPEPSLRSAAGARLTVIRLRAGHGSIALTIPLCTRCFASWQARSARPTIENAGRSAERRCASTSTRRGSSPTTAEVMARATTPPTVRRIA